MKRDAEIARLTALQPQHLSTKHLLQLYLLELLEALESDTKGESRVAQARRIPGGAVARCGSRPVTIVEGLRLHWEGNYRRRSARIGDASIEVERSGRRGQYRWRVGEVLGVRFSSMHLQQRDFETVEEAMVAAEWMVGEILGSILVDFRRCRDGHWRLR